MFKIVFKENNVALLGVVHILRKQMGRGSLKIIKILHGKWLRYTMNLGYGQMITVLYGGMGGYAQMIMPTSTPTYSCEDDLSIEDLI